jgi:potassium-transporting ATPase potassium-binding subunit
MNHSTLLIILYLAVLLAFVKPLGWYMARVYQNESVGLNRWCAGFERWLYKISGVDADEDMRWQDYAIALLCFNAVGFVVVFGLQLLQEYLPLNPEQLPAVSVDLAINTAVSFVTNTNWQSYGGETTLSYLTQMLGLTVQNFVSAATGMAVLVALIRGFIRHNQTSIGNFWVDMTRSVLYVLLPLSLLLAVLLVGQGVVQTFRPYQTVPLLENTSYQDQDKTVAVSEQVIALGPAASQVAIKQLGSNGGGFFNVNAAHPLENPTPLSNFLEMLAILLIPAALCYSFGVMVGDVRQGWAILATMLLLLIPLLFISVSAELAVNPDLTALNVDQSGGNMEGKELRFGITASSIWAVVTTAASNGSVNAMLDSFTAIGGMVSMWLMQLGEVVFGGVGSGLYGMLVFALVAVFVAGLMIGRTPEYLGKKIEAFEMQMAAIIILIPPLLVLGGTALAIVLDVGKASIFNTGAHGFSEVLYALSSAGNNNGSAFAGLSGNTVFYNLLLAFAMLGARFGLIVPVLAIAGSLAEKKTVPISVGTLPTHTPLFVLLLLVIVIMVGALTFIPALALGPIVEHLQWLGW